MYATFDEKKIRLMASRNACRIWGILTLVGITACGPVPEDEIDTETSPASPLQGTESDTFRDARREGSCGPDHIFVTSAALASVGLGPIARPETAGTCLDASEWARMKRDASKLLHVEMIENGPPDPAAHPDDDFNPQWGDDYYITNVTGWGGSEWIDTYQCRNTLYDTPTPCSISLQGRVSHNVNLSVMAAYGPVGAELGYEIGWEQTKTYMDSARVGPRRCIEFRFYADYDFDRFDLWEDDVLFDDYLGNYTTRRYLRTWVSSYECSL